MSDVIFKNKKANFEKLRLFGFAENNGVYTYRANIADGQLQITIALSKDEAISAQIIDPLSNDEYVLHRTAKAGGPFIGMVKADYERVLREIADKCFEPDVFKSDCAQKVLRYVQETYHDELEFLWRRFSDNAIFRRKETNKWYAALLVLSKKKLGLDSDEIVEIIDLRIKPENLHSLVDNKTFFPGYHMNKRHWYTICLDGSVPVEEICQRIDVSYELARK